MSYVSWFLCMLCNFLLRTGQFEYCGNAGNQILPLLRDWFCFLLRSSVVSLYSDFSKLFLQILSCVCYWRIILALSLWHLRDFFKCVGFFFICFVCFKCICLFKCSDRLHQRISCSLRELNKVKHPSWPSGYPHTNQMTQPPNFRVQSPYCPLGTSKPL